METQYSNLLFFYMIGAEMATASSAERYAGDHCKKLGLSINQFYSASQVMKITNIKKCSV